jgi:hypothetical protein
MTLYADRVKETTTTSGTGNITLLGNATGFQSCNAAFGLNNQFEYTIEAVDGSGNPTGDWEVGDGYLSGSTTLVRDQVRASSNSGALVSFASSTTKNVFCGFPAHRARSSNRQFSLQMGLP